MKANRAERRNSHLLQCYSRLEEWIRVLCEHRHPGFSVLWIFVAVVLIASSLSLAHAEGVPEGLGTFIGAWRARNAGQPWPAECDLNGDGVLDKRDADARLWQAFGGLWSQVRVLDAVTLEPLPGVTVTVAGSSAQTDAKGLAALGCRRGTQAVQVCGPGHVTWEGVLPVVPGFGPALYLVPAPLRVTVANHQEYMEATYNLAGALMPIPSELPTEDAVAKAADLGLIE